MPEISTILKEPDFSQIITKLCVDTKEDRNPREYLDEYNGKRTRREESVDNREDKIIDVYSDTEFDFDEDGNKVPKKIGIDTIRVARIHTNYPKKIVRTAANFLFGGDMSITFSENNEGTEYFRKVWEKKLRMKAVLKKFARTVMVETKAALLFYPRTNPDGTVDICVKILSIENSEIFPHFDDYHDMDGFIRKYTSYDNNSKEYERVNIYTANKIIEAYNRDGQWIREEKQELAGLITVVYAEIDQPEYEDEVTALDKLENRLSRIVDTNDYFSEPILKSYGATTLPSKKTVGKQIEFQMEVDDEGNLLHGDAEYLIWPQQTESIRLEVDELKSEILSGTSTPDLTFDNVKSIGNVTGIGMKMMFLDAFLKREDNMEIFEPVISRCISVVRAMICNVSKFEYRSQLMNIDIDVEFGSILPDDLREEMEILAIANGNKAINARKTVTARSRFTKDPDDEILQLQKEEQQEAANNGLVGMTIT